MRSFFIKKRPPRPQATHRQTPIHRTNHINILQGGDLPPAKHGDAFGRAAIVWFFIKQKTSFFRTRFLSGDPSGNRTHDYAVRGRRLSRLTIGPSISLTIISQQNRFVNSFFIFFRIFFEFFSKSIFIWRCRTKNGVFYPFFVPLSFFTSLQSLKYMIKSS